MIQTRLQKGFCIDTCALIDMRRSHYPPDVFLGLQADLETTNSELEEVREFKREGARKERVIADLEEELSIARSEAKRRRKEPEPEPEPPSRWARVLGSEPTPVERFVLEYNELMKEKRRQRDKKRKEELEKWREELRRKEEERQEKTGLYDL